MNPELMAIFLIVKKRQKRKKLLTYKTKKFLILEMKNKKGGIFL